MGKQKRLIKELEHALAQMEADWRTEHENAGCLLRSLMRNMSERATERKRHNMIVDAMAEGVNRVVGERDAALADVEMLTEANAEADATIGELRKGLETLQAQHSAVSDALDLEREHSAMTISKLRDDLADTRERLDAALTEAARMRKEWAGDVSAAREIVERKSNEIVDLRRTISELRGDLAKARGDLERVTESWQHAEDLLQERERELDAQQEHANQWSALCFRLGIAQASHIDAVIAAAQAQQEHAEPVVKLQAIEELEEGERLIDDNGAIIESVPGGYEVQGAIFQAFKATPVDALHYYHEITGK